MAVEIGDIGKADVGVVDANSSALVVVSQLNLGADIVAISASVEEAQLLGNRWTSRSSWQSFAFAASCPAITSPDWR